MMAESLMITKRQRRRTKLMLQPETEDSAASHVTELPADVTKDMVQLFKLFSDETRLRILHFLMQQDEFNVRELCDLLGHSQPAVSHHLALLRVAGLIESRRDGKHNFYSILHKRFRALMEMFFSATGQQGGRICFESFVLSYTPLETTG
jgi:ArsR family transcriptional regulator